MALTKIKTQSINDNAITNAKMADDAIDSADLADGSIDNVHLAGSIAVSKTLLAGGTGLTLSTNTLAVDAAQTQITSVGTLTSLNVAGSVSGDWVAKVDNTHATNGYGLYVSAGDDANVKSFAVADKDDNDAFYVKGDGNATFTSKVFINQDATNAYAFEIDHEGDAYNGLHVDASALTTGSAGHFYSNANRTADYPLVELQDDNASSSGYGLKIRCDGDGDFIRGMAQGNNTKWKVTNTGAMEISGANYDQLKIKGSGSESGIKFIDSDDNTDGFVYGSGGRIGFLNSSGAWIFQADSSKNNYLGTGFAMTSPNSTYTHLNAGAWGVLHRASWDVYETSNCYYNQSGQWIAKYDYANGMGVLGKWGGALVWETYNGAVTAGTNYTLTNRVRFEKNGNVKFSSGDDNGNILYIHRADDSIGDGNDLGGIKWTVDDPSADTVAGFIQLWGRGSFEGSARYSDMAFHTGRSGGLTEAMRIDYRGNVGVGVTNPDLGRLYVFNDSTTYTGFFQQNQGGGHALRVYASASDADNEPLLYCGTDDEADRFSVRNQGRIYQNGSQLHAESSDERLKKNISTISGVLTDLEKIRGVTFNWRASSEDFPKWNTDDHTKKHYGVIAQEVEKVYPELVNESGAGYKTMNYEMLVPILLQGMKELTARLEALENA